MQRDRLYLKSRFLTGSRPTQADFHDMIDSFFNHLDDAFENFGLTIYNPDGTYNTNDTCINNGCIYICNDRNVSGPFNPDKWDFVTEMPAVYTLNPWQSDINYNQYDVVRYKGKAYYSKLNNNSANIPTNTTWWQEVLCNKQNMVNWQPGIYFKNQKVIYNNNVYEVICDDYMLSYNAINDINSGRFRPILLKKYIYNLSLTKEADIINISNNYIIKVANLQSLKENDKVAIKSSSNEYYEVTIYNKYQDLQWRVIEILMEPEYETLYAYPNQYDIIFVNPELKQFTINGIVSFNFEFIQVKNSSSNDGFYTIQNIYYQGETTIITVNESINSNTIDGMILQYTIADSIIEVQKLTGCIIKISKDNFIEYRPNKYIQYQSKNYELLSINILDDSYDLIINISSLSTQEPYGTCLYGYTTQLPHNLNDYYFNYQIYNNERETVSLESLRLKALDLNNAEIDVKDPTKYSTNEHTIILIS